MSDAEDARAEISKKLVRDKVMRQRSIDASEERFKKLQRDLDKAFQLQEEAEEALAEFSQLAQQRRAIRDGFGRGNAVSDRFVRHARTLLSTGGSARSTLEQLHLNAGFFLSAEDYDVFMKDVPSLRWFQYHREGLGLESYLYTLMRIAKCERILQWGFDETSLDGVSTMNRWVRIEEAGELHVVTLECAGLLTGGTARKVGEHVRVFWERGQQAMTMLREQLGAGADNYAPLVNGVMNLSKLCGVMHDTCHAANAIARTVRVLRDP